MVSIGHLFATAKRLNLLAVSIDNRDTQETMPRPIRRCRRCRHALPPWSRVDARYCGDTCRQRAHREWRRASRAPVCEAGPIGVVAEKGFDKQTQIDSIEALMSALDRTSERVMLNVGKIMKPGA
jgi:hypothetical protein